MKEEIIKDDDRNEFINLLSKLKTFESKTVTHFDGTKDDTDDVTSLSFIHDDEHFQLYIQSYKGIIHMIGVSHKYEKNNMNVSNRYPIIKNR